MKVINEINDNLILGEDHYNKRRPYSVRRASRGVFLNGNGEVAMIHATNKGFYKLPGGGKKQSETPEETLKREILEETGYEVVNLEMLGITIEDKFGHTEDSGELQISTCFTGKLVGEPQAVELEEDELADGMELKFLTVEEAISQLESEQPTDYERKFIRLRDLNILKEFSRNT